MLWRTYLSLIGENDRITEPPERVLNLAVIGGVAHVSIHAVHETLNEPDPAAQCAFTVPARSLLRALQSALDEDDDERPVRALA